MFWFKTLIDKTLADDKLKLLGYEGLGIRYILICYIAKSPVMNYLYRTEIEPYTDNEIAILLTIELQKWLQLKKMLVTYGGFNLDNKNAVGIPKFSEHQSDYYRQKKYRQVTKKVTNELQTEVRSKKLEVRSKNNIYTNILNFWNSKNIIKHNSVTSKIRYCVNGKLKDKYTEQDIIKTIDNYNTILIGQEYMLDHKWTLQDFLQRGFEKLKDLDIAKNNYLKRDIKEKQEQNLQLKKQEQEHNGKLQQLKQKEEKYKQEVANEQ